jgi:photosystem II stability/assembly factor-like uncharacterized protein
MRFNRLMSVLALLTVLAPAMAGPEILPGHDLISSTDSKGEVRRWEITGPWGGDLRSLVASPDNNDLLYLGTSDGQIFRSTDGAATWSRLKPGLGKPGLSIDSILIDPRNTRVIYAGAWAVVNTERGGVFKSEDGGENWKLLEQTKGLSVRCLAMAPEDPNLIIAGSASEDRKLNGAFRSADAGRTWERITPEGDAEIHNVESIAIDAKDPSVIYAGTFHLPWKTTDGGTTWKPTGYKATGMIDDSDIFGISVDPSDPSLIYMNACSGIYRSNSRGEKWAKLPGIPFSARRTYALLPDPADPKVIFAGTSEGLWRTKDGGTRWMLLTSKNAVVRAIVIHPNKPNRVLIATDGFGVQISDNLGDDFSQSNSGFIHRHILAIMPDPAEHGRVLASVYHDGMSGSVYSSADDGETWRLSSKGLGTRDVYSFFQVPGNPDLIYAGTNTGVYRSNDRGESWSYVGVVKEEHPKKPVRKGRGRQSSTTATASSQKGGSGAATGTAQRRSRTAKKAEPQPAPPAGPILVQLDQQVDDLTGYVTSDGGTVLYAATLNGLYRTTNEAKGWEKLQLDGYDPTGRVFAVSTKKEAPDTIFAGTKEGLYISHDGGTTWDHVDRGPSDMSVKAIAQDPRDPNLVIVGTNQYIYRSTNGGRSWTLRGGGLTTGDYNTVTFNPANPDEVMAGDYYRGGVFRSSDKGYTWDRIDAGLPSTRVWILAFDPFDKDRLFAGSFSSGVYVLTIEHSARARSN